jgi:hypothetical protein
MVWYTGVVGDDTGRLIDAEMELHNLREDHGHAELHTRVSVLEAALVGLPELTAAVAELQAAREALVEAVEELEAEGEPEAAAEAAVAEEQTAVAEAEAVSEATAEPAETRPEPSHILLRRIGGRR